MNKLSVSALVVVLMSSAVMGMNEAGWLYTGTGHTEDNGVWDNIFTADPEKIGEDLVRSTAPVPSADNPRENVSSSSSADSVALEQLDAFHGN